MSASLLQRRALAPGELDHERLWLVVGSGAIAMGVAATRLGIRPPPCLFHLATGFPCPGCGSTRAMLQLFQGHVAAAFQFNPLITLLALAAAVWACYAAAVVFLKWPRLRIGEISRRAALVLRIGVVAALLANWWWVIAHGL